MSRFRDVIARMAVDSEFARHARANPEHVAKEHGLTVEEAAKLRGLADARSGTGPMALGARLSKSGFGTGGLGGMAAELIGSQAEEDPLQMELVEPEPLQMELVEPEPLQMELVEPEPLQMELVEPEPQEVLPTLPPVQQGETEDPLVDALSQPVYPAGVGGEESESPTPEGSLSWLIPEGFMPAPEGGFGDPTEPPGGPVLEFPEGFTPPYIPEGFGEPEPAPEGDPAPPAPPPEQDPGPAPQEAGPADAAPQQPAAPPPGQPEPAPVPPQAGPDQPAVALGSPAGTFAGPPSAAPPLAGIGAVSGQAQSLLPPGTTPGTPPDPIGAAQADADGIGAEEIAIGAAGAVAGGLAGGLAGKLAGKSAAKDEAPEEQDRFGPGPQPAI
jgi:hypothetical protein